MALAHIFEVTWPDPSKLGADAKSASLLLNEAKETFAGHLRVRSDEISFLGEANLGYHLGISGLLNPKSRLKMLEQLLANTEKDFHQSLENYNCGQTY